MYIDDNLKQELKKAFAPVSTLNTISLFEAIPAKKLKNAKSSYAPSMGSDETLVMLYDSTVFGSAKDGILLTSKRLYNKAGLEKPISVDIADITELYLAGADIILETDCSEIKIDNTGVLGNEWFLHHVLGSAIRLLGGFKSLIFDDDEGGNEQPSQELKCHGCGAVSSGSSNICEYCGAKLSMAARVFGTAPAGSDARYDVILTDMRSDEELGELIAMEIMEATGLDADDTKWPMTLIKSATKADVDIIRKIIGGDDVVVTVKEV